MFLSWLGDMKGASAGYFCARGDEGYLAGRIIAAVGQLGRIQHEKGSEAYYTSEPFLFPYSGWSISIAPSIAAAVAATAAAATLGLGTGFVHGQISAIDRLTIESSSRGLSLSIAAHFDESEPLRAAGIAVHDDLCRLHCAVGGEQ